MADKKEPLSSSGIHRAEGENCSNKPCIFFVDGKQFVSPKKELTTREIQSLVRFGSLSTLLLNAGDGLEAKQLRDGDVVSLLGQPKEFSLIFNHYIFPG